MTCWFYLAYILIFLHVPFVLTMCNVNRCQTIRLFTLMEQITFVFIFPPPVVH